MTDKQHKKSRPNILIVDDELGPRESLRMILKNRYNTFTADSGKDALDLLRKHQIDLITLDLRMPGMSGMEVLEKIKEINRDIEVIIITGYGSGDTIKAGVDKGIFDYFTKPFSVAEVVSSINRGVKFHQAIVSARSFIEGMEEFAVQPLDLSEAKKNLWSQSESSYMVENPAFSQENIRGKQSPEFNHLEFARAVARSLETSDRYCNGHFLEVAKMVTALADEMGLSAEDARIVEISALLHDIGMITVPAEAMDSRDSLDDSMREYIREHPRKAAELLSILDIEDGVIEAVFAHHERFDGAGYPRGISSNEIPLAARIIALGVAFQAMISPRPYRQALSWDMAVEAVRRGCGTQFDPEIGASFCGLLAEGRIGIAPARDHDAKAKPTEH